MKKNGTKNYHATVPLIARILYGAKQLVLTRIQREEHLEARGAMLLVLTRLQRCAAIKYQSTLRSYAVGTGQTTEVRRC